MATAVCFALLVLLKRYPLQDWRPSWRPNAEHGIEPQTMERGESGVGGHRDKQLELKGLGARVEEVAAEINYLNQNLAEEVAAHISGYRISESQLVGKVEDLTQQFTSYRQASQAKIEELEGKVSTMQLVAVLGLIIALIK